MNSQNQDNIKTLLLHRKLLAFSGAIYLLWWLGVDQLLPNAFNPLGSRLVVVMLIFAVLTASYVNSWVKDHIRFLFICSFWLITAHYYYLFYGNAGDVNWIVGSYITVIAINLCMFSNTSLLAYSIFVMVLSGLLVYLQPSLSHSVFLPGLLTIILQANIGTRSRMSVIKTLTESNERFELLFDSAFEGVLVHKGGLIVDVNGSLIKMLGYSKKEFISREVLSFIHPDGRKISSEKMSVADVSPYEAKVLKKDGSFLDVEIRAKNFITNKETARLVTILDISDRKRAEKDHIAALTLKENLRIRDEFISIASHELKTPISSLQLQVQLVERDLKKNGGDVKTHESIALFNRQIHRLTELVETMLDVSRISAGQFTLNLQRIDFAKIVHDIVNSQPNPRSVIKIDSPAHVYLSADPARLGQVVENLVTNALKYGEGKPVNVLLSTEASDVILVIEDFGLGVAPEFTSKIFDRFERAISPRNISGFGLGLYIVKQIVETHGGSITIHSRLGEGSRFTVRLPIR